MEGDGPSELSQQDGGKVSEEELVKVPISPILPNSPDRSHQPSNSLTYSPERTPIDPPYASGNPEDSRGAGPRRRSSRNRTRRHSGGDYDLHRPGHSVDGGSRRRMRSRDDGYYRDEERRWSRRDDNAHHPDYAERSKPHRSYRNAEGWERGPSSASKPYVEESRFDRDLERGKEDLFSEEKGISDEDSLDVYNHHARRKRPARRTVDFKSLSPEEKAEVMRLPWIQWMNSSVKNRKSDAISRVVYANSR
jgi:aquaporin related protein